MRLTDSRRWCRAKASVASSVAYPWITINSFLGRQFYFWTLITISIYSFESSVRQGRGPRHLHFIGAKRIFFLLIAVTPPDSLISKIVPLLARKHFDWLVNSTLSYSSLPRPFAIKDRYGGIVDTENGQEKMTKIQDRAQTTSFDHTRKIRFFRGVK